MLSVVDYFKLNCTRLISYVMKCIILYNYVKCKQNLRKKIQFTLLGVITM